MNSVRGKTEKYRLELGIMRLIRGVNGGLRRDFGLIRRAKYSKNAQICDLAKFKCVYCKETGLRYLSGSVTDPVFLQKLSSLLPASECQGHQGHLSSHSLPPTPTLNLTTRSEANRSHKLSRTPCKSVAHRLERLAGLVRSRIQRGFDLIQLSRAGQKVADQSLTFDFSAENSPA